MAATLVAMFILASLSPFVIGGTAYVANYVYDAVGYSKMPKLLDRYRDLWRGGHPVVIIPFIIGIVINFFSAIVFLSEMRHTPFPWAKVQGYTDVVGYVMIGMLATVAGVLIGGLFLRGIANLVLAYKERN